MKFLHHKDGRCTAATVLKKRFITDIYHEIFRVFRNSFSSKQPRTAHPANDYGCWILVAIKQVNKTIT